MKASHGAIRRTALAALGGLLLACMHAEAVAVEELQVLALGRDRAILRVDGARHVLSVGETSPEGVTLVEADTRRAVVRIDGVEEELTPGAVVFRETHRHDDPAPREKVTLYADGRGFFHADGEINGRAVRFLVDTGASTIAISTVMAEELGIDLSNARPGIATTASGVTRMSQVRIARVTVGGIVLHDVPAGVLEGDYPRVPLLGMSFLGQLDMRREGDRMELLRRN
jgi:aspartyl protease family protein